MSSKRGRPSKGLTYSYLIRVNPEDIARWREAAKKSHLPLSSWVRSVLLREADSLLVSETGGKR